MSELFAGIDGGQSSTTAVIGDERGRILGRATAGPADEVGAEAQSTRLRDALAAALDGARRAGRLPPEVRYRAVVAGVSGYEGRVYGVPPDLPADSVTLLHDAPIALAGALAGRPGAIVIAGTGSVVFSRDGTGRERMLGGWGYLFGDEGSAFVVAAATIANLMRLQDRGDGEERIAEVCRTFEAPSLRALARRFYAGELTRDRIAAFAPHAIRLPEAQDALASGADGLAELACRAVAGMADPMIALIGGMFSDDAFRDRVRSAIERIAPGVRVIDPIDEPAAGALHLAYGEAGLHFERFAR